MLKPRKNPKTDVKQRQIQRPVKRKKKVPRKSIAPRKTSGRKKGKILILLNMDPNEAVAMHMGKRVAAKLAEKGFEVRVHKIPFKETWQGQIVNGKQMSSKEVNEFTQRIREKIRKRFPEFNVFEFHGMYFGHFDLDHSKKLVFREVTEKERSFYPWSVNLSNIGHVHFLNFKEVKAIEVPDVKHSLEGKRKWRQAASRAPKEAEYYFQFAANLRRSKKMGLTSDKMVKLIADNLARIHLRESKKRREK